MRRVLVTSFFVLLLISTSFAQVPSKSDVTYAKTPTGDLKLDVYLPDADVGRRLPVLVRVSPTRETPAGPAADLLKKGYALVYAAYLPEKSPRGRVFSQFPQDLHAGKAAIRWVRGNAEANNIDSRSIGVWGAGHGATVAALLAMTGGQRELGGKLGEYLDHDSDVRTACLFGGTTDWRNAELYGDESVNIRGSPAYQLFGGNPKDYPDDARLASAVNYIRPTSPPILMCTLASDSNRAMHLIFAETLKRAGVASALYEERAAGGAAGGGRNVDEARLNSTILEFFADTLASPAPRLQPLSIEQEIDQLVKAGLFKQARRLIEEQLAIHQAAANKDPAGRDAWMKKLGELTQKQQVPAVEKLAAALKNQKSRIQNQTFTLREVLTDPDHIGEYSLEANPTAREYDRRANALRLVEGLNNAILADNIDGAQKQSLAMRNLINAKDAAIDPQILETYLARYNELRAVFPNRAWPPGTKPLVYALGSGQDLYGYWFTMRAGNVTQRFRYIPPGSFAMGSAKDEWSRLPGEPILEPTEIKEGFWLADSPVTQDMWEGVMGKGANRSHFKSGRNPVENVSYAHAVNFLQKVGVEARLPTEAEFEYACRAGVPSNAGGGGSRAMYPVTGRLADSAWFWDEAQTPGGVPTAPDIRILHELEAERNVAARSTHAVRGKLPNAWGLYDMQGNVWEWCAGSSADKPRDYHPARGGSWISIPQSCRAARSTWFNVEQESWNLGLRIVIPATGQ